MTFDRSHSMVIGSYTDFDALAHQPKAPVAGRGITRATLSADGAMRVDGVIPQLNPAVLIPHPNGRVIYALTETIVDEGTVTRYAIDGAEGIAPLDEWTASGRSTCYLAVSPKRDAAIVINYWDAIIDVVRLDEDGRIGATTQSFRQHHRPDRAWRQVTDREDHWGNRQVGPHAHCAHFWHDRVFIPDLGENAVFQYRWDADAARLVPETHIAFEPGSGPRHMAMHPSLPIAYVSNELINSVCVATLDDSEPEVVKPRLTPVQYVSTIEDRGQTSYVSEITLSSDARFLYVSNRGDDTIAVFRVLEDGRLSRIALVPTGGRFPRHFALTPDGRGVLVANQDSGTVRLFDRDPATGLLEATETVLDVPAPNYIRFVGA